MLRLIVVLLSLIALVNANSCDNSCSGHGVCGSNSVCQCYEGWGMGLSLDSGDCSQRICPFEYAWVDSPDRIGNHHKYVECSAKGICNRDSGECECFPGYEGKACARTTCPNDCSGHGQCVYLDKEPFKTVIGEYNNYNYAAKYAAAMITTPAAGTAASITAPATIIAKLTPNNRVVIGATIYYVKSVTPSTSSFTFAATVGGTAMNTAATGNAGLAAGTAILSASAGALIALPPNDLRSFTASGSASGQFSSVIAHGLKVGDIVYLSGITAAMNTDETEGLNNVLYAIATVPSAYTFTITTLALKVDGATATAGAIAADNAVLVNIKVNVLIPNGALTITSGAPTITVNGQFDVVEPYIDSLTSYIDKKYWDAKKTRGCVCDPQYGDIDCSARLCQYGTDVMNTQKDLTVAAKNQIQLVSFTGGLPAGAATYAGSFHGTSKGKTFALTFTSKLNETFTTIPINLPYLPATITVATALAAFRNFELDTEWALKTLPNSVIDGVKVRVTKPVDTTGVTPASDGIYDPTKVLLSASGVAPVANAIGGTTAGHNVFEFSVEFSGNSVQGTQRYLTVEAAACGAGCFPRIDGIPIHSEIGGNTFVTVVTQPTQSTGMDNDMESDMNSYECGRRGKCDYKTGLCTCFSGYTGLSCNVITALV